MHLCEHENHLEQDPVKICGNVRLAEDRGETGRTIYAWITCGSFLVYWYNLCNYPRNERV